MTKRGTTPNPTLAAVRAAALQPADRGVVTLSTGVRARIKPVSAKLLDDIARSVPEPAVPRQFIEEKGREEYNPLDPGYLAAVKEANHLRGLRSTEALIMLGIELQDEVPPVDDWLPKLEFLARRGAVDLTAFDLTDPLEVEFVYKTMIAVATPDLMLVSMASGLTEAEVAEAMAGFQRATAGRSDPGGGAAA